MEKSKMKKINQKEERSLRNDRIKRIKNEGNEVESDGRRNRDGQTASGGGKITEPRGTRKLELNNKRDESNRKTKKSFLIVYVYLKADFLKAVMFDSVHLPG